MRITIETQIVYEQGMEGIALAVYDISKEGWAGHIDLNNGDHLIIPGKFKGYIKKTKMSLSNPFKWTQEGWNSEEWYMLFYPKLMGVYRKNYTQTVYTKEFNLKKCVDQNIIY